MATKPKTDAEVRKHAIAAVLTTIDGDSWCYCEGRRGQNHDQNPPCERVKQATAIVDSISSLLISPTTQTVN